MLFARFALPFLALAGSAFAHTPSTERSTHLSKRLSVGAEASISTALTTATTEIRAIGVEIKQVLEDVDVSNPTGVVSAVDELLVEVHSSLTVLASACVSITRRSLVERTININAVGQLVADLLNTVIATLKPVQDLIATEPLLGPLLAPYLTPINVQLVIILNGLLAAVAGLLNVVLGLLDVSVAPILRSLGFSPILSLLNL
ncbi:hypothetical protein JCM10212_005172 [Sporobolomyces blumeae]